MAVIVFVLGLPAFWGLCGGLLSGAHGLMTAYSAKAAGTPEARRKAWMRLGFGLIAGPIAAEALTVHVVLKLVPVMAMQAAALTIGWMVANDPRALFDMMTRIIRAALNPEPKP